MSASSDREWALTALPFATLAALELVRLLGSFPTKSDAAAAVIRFRTAISEEKP